MYFFAVCLVIPKVNLIQISGQTSGIRLDDIFVMLSTPYLLMQIGRCGPALRGLRVYLAFIILALVSGLIHIEANGWKLLLYPARLIEYLVFILAGALCADRKMLIMVCLAIIFLNTGAAIGQVFFDLGGFPYSRYVSEVEGRAIGLGAGPWEMAAIVNLSMAYLYYAWGSKGQKPVLFLLVYLVALVGLILTESRVGLMVSTFTVSLFVFQLDMTWVKRLLALLAVAVVSVAVFLSIPNSLAERSKDLVDSGNLDQTVQIGAAKIGSAKIGAAKTCGPSNAGGELNFQVINDGAHDPSWGVRAKKWATAACIFLNDPQNIPLGVGPGYFGPALDGGFVRVLVEHGALGILVLLLSLAGLDPAFRNYRVIAMVFAAHMVFIDIYLSYKFTSLLLFLLGAMLTLDFDETSGHAAKH